MLRILTIVFLAFSFTVPVAFRLADHPAQDMFLASDPRTSRVGLTDFRN
jgi:hypothetical protein